jgi:cell division protein FtsB
MSWRLAVLLGLLVWLQAQLWLGDGGIAEASRLGARVTAETATNSELERRNDTLERQVVELKQGTQVIESRAREELGLVKEDEIYYQFPTDPATEGRP